MKSKAKKEKNYDALYGYGFSAENADRENTLS